MFTVWLPTAYSIIDILSKYIILTGQHVSAEQSVDSHISASSAQNVWLMTNCIGLYLVWQTIAYSCKSKFQKCIETSFVRADARGEGKARGDARAKAGVKMQGLGRSQVQGKVKLQVRKLKSKLHDNNSRGLN